MNSDMTVHPEPERVFEDAIARGFLSADPDSAIWAGLYMYLFHDAEGRAHFKHRDTRRYRVMPVPASRSGGGTP